MSDFAEETTIHGVAEFYRLRGNERLLWIKAFCGSLAFLSYGSVNLMDEYVHQKSVTKIDLEEVRLPPFAFVRNVDDVIDSSLAYNHLQAVFAGKETRDFADIKYRFNRSDAFQKPSCMVNNRNNSILDAVTESRWHWNGYYWQYGIAEEKSVDSIVKETDVLIEAFGGLQQLALKIGENPNKMYWISSDIGCDRYKLEDFESLPIITQASYGGLKHIIDTRGSSSSSSKEGLRVELIGCTDRYHLLLGTSAFKVDSRLYERLELECGFEYTITVSLTHFSREHAYCSKKQTESEFSCLTDCWMEETKKNASRCMPYLGASDKTVGVTICPAYWLTGPGRCEPGYEKCKALCDSCPTCDVMCEEVVATVTSIVKEKFKFNQDQFLQHVDPFTGSPGAPESHAGIIRLHSASRESMMHVHISQKISTMDMISSLGGTLGLCIGASLLSFLHLITFCTKAARRGCQRLKQKLAPGSDE